MKLYYTIIDSSNDVVFASPIYHIEPISFSVYRFGKIQCVSSSPVHYEFVDSSIPLNINPITGEISSENHCPNLNEVLVKCSDVSDKQKSAYTKVKFDQICRENSIKQSNIDWINKIGEERRKRIRYQESPTPLVRNSHVEFTILSSLKLDFRLNPFVIVVNNRHNLHLV